MEAAMKAFGRDQNYEIYKTTTDDGFVLTLFRLLPKAAPASKKGAVLVQHGLGMDATSWFSPQIYTDGNADTHALFALADEGYDVFLSNSRISPYSNVHTKYPDADKPSSPNYAAQNKAKYASGWYEMGKYDVPANLKKVTEVAGVEKATYIGYSQGTSQMFYALATNDATVNAKVDRAIMLAPCLYIDDETAEGSRPVTMDLYNSSVGVFESAGVYHIGEPNLDANTKKICTGAKENEAACETIKQAPYIRTMGVASLKQYYQVAISNRFQQTVADFTEDTME